MTSSWFHDKHSAHEMILASHQWNFNFVCWNQNCFDSDVQSKPRKQIKGVVWDREGGTKEKRWSKQQQQQQRRWQWQQQHWEAAQMRQTQNDKTKKKKNDNDGDNNEERKRKISQAHSQTEAYLTHREHFWCCLCEWFWNLSNTQTPSVYRVRARESQSEKEVYKIKTQIFKMASTAVFTYNFFVLFCYTIR